MQYLKPETVLRLRGIDETEYITIGSVERNIDEAHKIFTDGFQRENTSILRLLKEKFKQMDEAWGEESSLDKENLRYSVFTMYGEIMEIQDKIRNEIINASVQ